ncbi:MAG: hypothetical protein GY749_45455 [Desulfobacteraceae bacterium]|nr:hypothetical protein [Desulfobacteraceae bacterium]
MENINALLVFCEGPHDVAFCRLVFKFCFKINKISWKFSEYPSPLNQLFKASMEKHAAQDMSLDMAHKFFLPDRTLYSREKKQLVLLFNTGGKTKTDNPKNFLEDFLPLLKQSKIFPDGADKVVDKCKYLFLYDRDHKTPSDVFSWCKNTFSNIGDENFISDDLKTLEGNNLAAICMDKTVGSYVFSPADSFGTLEDILLPMFESAQNEVVSKTEEFIDECFDWKTEHENNIQKTAETAKRKKAIITVSGQRKKPGSSMNVVIDQGKLIPKEVFSNNSEVRRFADFVAFLSEL